MESFTHQGARPEVARCHTGLAAMAETGAERLRHRRQAEAVFREMGESPAAANVRRPSGDGSGTWVRDGTGSAGPARESRNLAGR